MLGWEAIGLLKLYLTNLSNTTLLSSGKQSDSWRKKHRSNVFTVYHTLKVWMLFVLHNWWLSNWSQWELWAALYFRRACHIPRICWVPKNNLGKLCLCISANHGNAAVGSVDIDFLWTPRRWSFSAMQNSEETVCLGHVRLLNSRYLSKYIYPIYLFNIAPSPFSGNTQWIIWTMVSSHPTSILKSSV